MSHLAAGDLSGGSLSPKAYECGILTHKSLWSDFGLKWKGRYPPSEIVIPCYPQIPSNDCIFLFALVVFDLINKCLSIISYQISSLVVKDLIFRLIIYLLIYPIRMVWYPSPPRSLCPLQGMREMALLVITYFLGWRSVSSVEHILRPGLLLPLEAPVYRR